jgi:hypothetical protein
MSLQSPFKQRALIKLFYTFLRYITAFSLKEPKNDKESPLVITKYKIEVYLLYLKVKFIDLFMFKTNTMQKTLTKGIC